MAMPFSAMHDFDAHFSKTDAVEERAEKTVSTFADLKSQMDSEN